MVAHRKRNGAHRGGTIEKKGNRRYTLSFNGLRYDGAQLMIAFCGIVLYSVLASRSGIGACRLDELGVQQAYHAYQRVHLGYSIWVG